MKRDIVSNKCHRLNHLGQYKILFRDGLSVVFCFPFCNANSGESVLFVVGV